MDATRALLDELMGEDRNGDRQKCGVHVAPCGLPECLVAPCNRACICYATSVLACCHTQAKLSRQVNGLMQACLAMQS